MGVPCGDANLAPARANAGWGFCFYRARVGFYFSWLEMLVNVVFRLEPIVFTTAIIAIEMPAAIRPYSMAVAPLSSLRKRKTSFFIGESPVL